MDAPKDFDEAFEMAIVAANLYLERVIELAGARAALELRKYNLEAARRLDFSEDEIAKAAFWLEQAQYNVRVEQAALERETGKIHVWDSGYQYDDNGNEYMFNVSYRRRDWDYEVTRSDDSGEYFHGFFCTLEEAVAFAESIIYPRELDARPAPEFSLEDSSAAGDIIINFRGEAQAIKAIVDKVLDEANHGCGQHYEIFARRARNALDELPLHVANPHDREALEKYLAYDRF